MSGPDYTDVMFTESGRTDPDDRPMWDKRASRIRYIRSNNITGICEWCGKKLHGEINIHDSCAKQKEMMAPLQPS